jgi:competence protein ComK
MKQEVIKCEKNAPMSIATTFIQSISKELTKLFIVNYYIIQPQILYMFGEFDRNGKLCTIVMEETQSFVVDQPPLKVLADSIEYIGSDFKGSLAGARKNTGKSRMCPVMVNYILNICLFPDRGYRNNHCIWINSNYIMNTKPLDKKTMIEFSNGSSLIVNSRLHAFREKIHTAEQYRKMNYERGKNPMSFVLDSKKRPLRKRE